MSGPAPTATPKVRRDVQGLRTLAVGLVVLYHLFPEKLTGGFVGVDIFLVISGFLIVGSLVRGATATGTINLATFYARRIRRLLPASTAVLLAVMGASVLVLPQSRWQDVSRDIVASALQVQNWNQAFGSASYEAAGELVSPVQHFWSLAVEEQFYLVIPLLLLAAVFLGRLMKQSARTACLWFLAVLCAASLVHSVLFSGSNHDLAYFATTTRMWELGLGGIAALVLPSIQFTPALRVAAGWAGLGLVALGACTFTTAMAFPGYIALVPVLGTILMIFAGMGADPGTAPGPASLSYYLSLRPVTYIGDISYSLYLWHWPVIVFYILLQGHQPGLVGGAGLLALSLVLAALSHRFIEQRFRYGKPFRRNSGRRFPTRVRNRSAYGLAAVLVAVSCAAAVGPWSVVAEKTIQLVQLDNDPNYPGAMAFAPHHPAAVPPNVPISPDPAIATKDVPLTSKDDCGVYDPKKIDDSRCYYGSPAANRTMVLVGDSHAAQYIDPIAAAAGRSNWQVRAMVRNGCPFSAAPPASATTTYTNCSSQNAVSLKKILAMKPDSVVVSGMTDFGYGKALKWRWSSERTLVDGYVAMLRPLRDAGIKVSVIADTPYPGVSVPDCVEKNGPSAPRCDVPNVAVKDPLVIAAREVGGVTTIDLKGYLCSRSSCPPVVGNVLVYRDNHLTATFARTLSAPLEKALAMN
ncbi:acyltransferase [Arthrobacter sp. ERGS1:01]|uniref:acyltransferase family protein n=1 Tax=Arthrobacter sp. ERGS1:01 TaxID=1704044 RepID=UPI0006B4B0E1|nr:acyltransferase family protein [Arthrobacter sp. ERGS1:01]ALE06664.1 acyltransferase [Arthrobacter sp. ERGS1:01]